MDYIEIFRFVEVLALCFCVVGVAWMQTTVLYHINLLWADMKTLRQEQAEIIKKMSTGSSEGRSVTSSSNSLEKSPEGLHKCN